MDNLASHPDSSEKLAYFSYYLLGCGTLLPWNAFITAADYFNELYPDQHVERLLTLTYLPVNLIVLILIIFKFHNTISTRTRILSGFAGFTIIVALVPLLDIIAPHKSLLAVLTLVAAAGVADGIVQGAVFGDAATLPSKYTQAVVGGTAISGVAVSLLRIITKAMFSSSISATFGLRASAQLYFLLSAAVCAACYYVYSSVIPTLPAIQYYRQSIDIQLALDDDIDINNEGMNHHNTATKTNQSTSNGEGGEEHSITSSTIHLNSQSSQSSPDFKAIYTTHITTLSISMIIIYIITLSIFPGVITEDITSTNTWYPILLITMFNIADWIGKSVPYTFMIHSSSGLLYCSISRTLFIPLFYLCSSGSSGGNSNVWGVGVLSVMLGVSNGWMTSSAFVAAADKVVDGGDDVEKAGMVGNLMVLSLVVGLCVGAACGMLWLV